MNGTLKLPREETPVVISEFRVEDLLIGALGDRVRIDMVEPTMVLDLTREAAADIVERLQLAIRNAEDYWRYRR